MMRFPKLLASLGVAHVVLLAMVVQCTAVKAQVERSIAAMAASADGSAVVVGIEDVNLKGAKRAHLVIALRPATGAVLWRYEPVAPPRALSLSPKGDTVAVGLWGQNPAGEGLFLLRASSGEQVAALAADDKLEVDPGATYPRWGGGMEHIEFSPDGSLLYGLTGDTLFAWDTAAKRYLWARDVPAVIEAPPEQPDPLPYGHASTFALSPDGRQIAAARNNLRVATAGRVRPGHFIQRVPALAMDIPPARPAFSADSRTLAAGEMGFSDHDKTTLYATDLWIAGATRSVKLPGCGGGIAWTSDPAVFGCQNGTGAHLRNVHDPQKDIGAAGPVSDLPILKVGGSLWAVAYENTDWKDPGKPLPLTLVELGTGKQVKITLPGRP